ncbi:MAG: type II/IV secretion system protein [Rhizobacter sp.]|nr:type II/IV secretion system protein [Rhizobacter sp.]
MSAVLEQLVDKATAIANDDPSSWLPTSGAPWALNFERWPQAEAQRWRVLVAVSATGAFALLADRPADAMLRERIESQLKRGALWVACDANAIDTWLGAAATGFRALDQLGENFVGLGHGNDAAELSALNLAEQSSPVVRLLDSTLYDALQDGASDVHLESTLHGLRIRYRIDGVMVGVREVDGQVVAEQVVSRLKVMAELDIGERRLPQDGRFKLRMHGRDIDFRLSVMPTVFGEDAVVRVLDRAQIAANGQLTLAALGFGDEAREAIRRLASQPYGMLLVAGPTGSGKTTTLYAAISETNTGRDKIITIEDPVEYQLPGTVQIPVNEKKGLSFARGLRSVLRHDPDRVMVGEIRDAETAQIAVQAALTGHLVFSTVHANSAFDVIGRFMHMGLDLYNVVSALNGVLAQRLMRVNCPHCARPFIPPHGLLVRLGIDTGGHHSFARGHGCPHCRHTGYKGRTAMIELLTFDDELRDLVVSRAPMSRFKQVARANGMVPLRHTAVQAVCRGVTTFEELDRVTLAD